MSTSAQPARSIAPGPTPVAPHAGAVLRPLGLDEVRIRGGFWAPRQQANRSAAIPAGREQLERAGNLRNLRIAAGQEQGKAEGPIFADSDVYKWLEAVAWEYARSGDESLLTLQREVTAVVAAAQCDDGYLNSVVTVRRGREGRYTDLPWSHEHYCAGHLIQAAVAQVRCTGDRALLDVAVRLADHLVATFGPGGRGEVDGHPVIEMALVELYRETDTRSYLELADWFVHRRGTGQTGATSAASAYFSDRVPVVQQTTVEGHAVRAVYLGAGATDVALESGDASLLAALQGQFAAMWATKTYLTGGLGARWEGEAFGDPYELPPDRAYAETCAAIGGIQWAWRLLLATGDPAYADAIERMLCNGFLAGVSLSGDEYFYVNPLQLRGDALVDGDRAPAQGRRGWFACACCPPNIMRTLSSLDTLLAGVADDGLVVHQYAPATIEHGDLALTVTTDYPWDGLVEVVVDRAPGERRPLRLRIPGWAEGARLTINDEEQAVRAGTYAQIDRAWTTGDHLRLELPMAARLVEADPRVDAVRGCVAVERGPLVYAFEQVDQANGVGVDDLTLDDARELEPRSVDDLGGVTVLKGHGGVRLHDPAEWPYAPPGEPAPDRDVPITAVPYYAWANRDVGAMRVWLPRIRR